MDKFGVVRTISKTTNGSGQSMDFVNMAKLEMQTGKNRNAIKTRVSASTKLPGTDRLAQPLVKPLVDNGASIEEALTNKVSSRGEQNEQMSLRMSELEMADQVERESLREEVNRNRQEVSRSEKRLKERTDELLAENLSRLTREAEQRQLRLRDDMEKLRIEPLNRSL